MAKRIHYETVAGATVNDFNERMASVLSSNYYAVWKVLCVIPVHTDGRWQATIFWEVEE